MSKTPFMPLWVSDFLGDTLDLDAAEIGAYMLLLMAQWNRDGDSLPNDDAKLRRVARCGRNWPKIWDTIGRYFEHDEAGVYSPRLRLEAQNVAAKREVNAHNGARGGRAKALKNNEQPLANATVSLQRNPSIPEPYPYNSSKDETDKPSEADFDSAQSAVWAMGPALLSKSGIAKPRPVIGKWLKQSKAEDVLAAITAAISAKTKDPVPYITATLAGRLKEAKIGDLRVLANGQRQRYHGAFDGWMNDYD